MEHETPPAYGTTKVIVGGIAKDGEVIFGGATNKVTHTEVKGDPENDWPEPEAVKYEWVGKTRDGKDVTAEVTGKLGERIDRVDVLAEVPKFVKSIVGGVSGTKPYIYQVRPLADHSMPAILTRTVLSATQALAEAERRW